MGSLDTLLNSLKSMNSFQHPVDAQDIVDLTQMSEKNEILYRDSSINFSSSNNEGNELNQNKQVQQEQLQKDGGEVEDECSSDEVYVLVPQDFEHLSLEPPSHNYKPRNHGTVTGKQNEYHSDERSKLRRDSKLPPRLSIVVQSPHPPSSSSSATSYLYSHSVPFDHQGPPHIMQSTSTPLNHLGKQLQKMEHHIESSQMRTPCFVKSVMYSNTTEQSSDFAQVERFEITEDKEENEAYEQHQKISSSVGTLCSPPFSSISSTTPTNHRSSHIASASSSNISTKTSKYSEHSVGALLAYPDSFSGWLKKQGTSGLLPFKSWKKRFVILTPTLLYLFKNDELHTCFHDVMLLNNISHVNVVDKHRFMFQVTGECISTEKGDIKQFTFQAIDKIEMKVWLKAFKNVFTVLKMEYEHSCYRYGFQDGNHNSIISTNANHQTISMISTTPTSVFSMFDQESPQVIPSASYSRLTLPFSATSPSRTSMDKKRSMYLVNHPNQNYPSSLKSIQHEQKKKTRNNRSTALRHENKSFSSSGSIEMKYNITPHPPKSANLTTISFKPNQSRSRFKSNGTVDIYEFMEQIQQLDDIRASRSKNIFCKQ